MIRYAIFRNDEFLQLRTDGFNAALAEMVDIAKHLRNVDLAYQLRMMVPNGRDYDELVIATVDVAQGLRFTESAIMQLEEVAQ